MLRIAITAGSALVVAGAAFAVVGTGHSASAAPVARPTLTKGTTASESYSAVARALTQGKDVEITTELQQCTSPNGQPGPDVIGGLHISAFQIVPGQFIAFSDTHPTLDPQDQSITQFIRYTVAPNGATTVATTTLAASGQVESTVQLDCQIGEGAYFNW